MAAVSYCRQASSVSVKWCGVTSQVTGKPPAADGGEAPGTIAHYVDADGGGGWIIAESDDAASGYATTIRYQPYLRIETSVIISIDQAVTGILEALA